MISSFCASIMAQGFVENLCNLLEAGLDDCTSELHDLDKSHDLKSLVLVEFVCLFAYNNPLPDDWLIWFAANETMCTISDPP